MLMTCLSYAGKPEGRSERRTDMKPMKEIYLAGGCFWGTEHFLKQIWLESQVKSRRMK